MGVNVNAKPKMRHGFSLAELVTVVAVLGLLAAMIAVRVSGHTEDAKINACATNKGDIEIQAQLWYRNHGSYPAADLSNIGSDVTYFPSGLPTCPVNNSAYTIDTATGLVVGHNH
jgi:general secretion pathway protein G